MRLACWAFLCHGFLIVICITKKRFRAKSIFIDKNPSLADGDKIAERLLIHACSTINSLECEQVYLSVPVRNENAHRLVEKFFHIEKHEQIEWRINSKVETEGVWDGNSILSKVNGFSFMKDRRSLHL